MRLIIPVTVSSGELTFRPSLQIVALLSPAGIAIADPRPPVDQRVDIVHYRFDMRRYDDSDIIEAAAFVYLRFAGTAIRELKPTGGVL